MPSYTGAPDSDADLTIGGALTPRPSDGGPVRFAPGSIIAGRYRLVALVGRGGMGEVYRAEDLTLDQPVALKFLPEGAADAAALARFHNELRIARQVSHKNVCRLYDLGEAGGRRFLTMEYVDGEDLASLLRRIGRIPQDKGIDIARQLCAGIAAAHERGVLHRDLKPANVMLDGDGNVRITDFGIATAAHHAAGEVAGTPQYMAPELLAGAPASIRTDLFALGLVLFEIFTGRRAFEARTLAELKTLHETTPVTTPSSIVRDIEPAIERVILRCLARNPDERPGSALAVAAALPGANPLAAALAAGETPSPELLAAAGEADALGVGRGLAALAFIVAGVIVIVAASPLTTVAGRSTLDKQAPVLVDRAQQILRSFGYTDAPADTAFGFSTNQAYLRWVASTDSSPQRWDVLRSGNPNAVILWYRTSPRLLVPTRLDPRVTPADPPFTVSGMTQILLDASGRLTEFQAVPPQIANGGDPSRAPDWQRVFDAAGLDMSTFTPVAPEWSPRDYADARAAWEGPLTGRPQLRVRVEAAAFQGRPTSMFLLGPWSRPTRMAPLPRSTSQTILNALTALLLMSLTIAALLIARHNVRVRRADVTGASRLAIVVLIGFAIVFLLSAHHVPDVQAEMNLFLRAFGGALTDAALLWVLYLALEPYVRRLWPDGILGWTRLLSGYVRDPRVGRDLLTGSVITMVIAASQVAYDALPPVLGYPARQPSAQAIDALSGAASTIGIAFDGALNGVFAALFLVLGYVVLRLLVRRTSIAIAAAALLLAVVQAPSVLSTATPWWISSAFQAVIIACVTIMVVRFGLLVTAVALGVGNIISSVPLTYSLTHWTAPASNLAIGVVLAVAVFGFYASRAGQPLFGEFDL